MRRVDRNFDIQDIEVENLHCGKDSMTRGWVPYFGHLTSLIPNKRWGPERRNITWHALIQQKKNRNLVEN